MSVCLVLSCYMIKPCTMLLFQAEDGIRDLVRSRGLGDVYKRQANVLDKKSHLRLLGVRNVSKQLR